MANSNPRLDREDENTVLGRNAVIELLRGSREVECVYICDEVPARGQPISRIVAMAKERGVPVKKVDAKKLDALSNGLPHQGVAALAAAFSYSTVDGLFARADGEPPFFLVADGIEDPHNLGAIIRTAEAAGAHGLILPKRGGSGAHPHRGAHERRRGRAPAGRAGDQPRAHARGAQKARCVDLRRGGGRRPLGRVRPDRPGRPRDRLGGVRPLPVVRETCDVILSLPMLGKVNSLNASVAAGILMYEVVRQRTRAER